MCPLQILRSTDLKPRPSCAEEIPRMKSVPSRRRIKVRPFAALANFERFERIYPYPVF